MHHVLLVIILKMVNKFTDYNYYSDNSSCSHTNGLMPLILVLLIILIAPKIVSITKCNDKIYKLPII